MVQLVHMGGHAVLVVTPAASRASLPADPESYGDGDSAAFGGGAHGAAPREHSTPIVLWLMLGAIMVLGAAVVVRLHPLR